MPLSIPGIRVYDTRSKVLAANRAARRTGTGDEVGHRMGLAIGWRPQRQAGRLAASVQSEPADLFVVIVVVKVIALIVKHRMRYVLPCCVDAGGKKSTV
jgi:hypothetical protein